MRTLLASLVLGFVLTLPAWGEVIWSQPRDFYVDPPQGWTFVEDPSPEHFVMTDGGRTIILEIFSQDKKDQKDLGAKAADLKARLKASGDEQTFTWNDRPAWLADLSWEMGLASGPLKVRGWALVADDGDGWVSALAYTPATGYDKASDTLVSTLDSLALGADGRKLPGPLSTFFQSTAGKPQTETVALKGLPSPLSVTYNLDLDEAVQATMERETRILTAQIGTQVKDQRIIAPGWSRFYRQIYRQFYSSLTPVSAYWQAQVDAGKVTAQDLPQTVLTWLQKFEYSRKGGLTDLSTPWQTLKSAAGDCDSRSLVYLALMDQLGVKGILMVSAPLSHGMAALDLPGQGARFPWENKGWLVAELTDTVNLGMIAQKMADPSQWIGIDLWVKP
jgi:hypothetical protein